MSFKVFLSSLLVLFCLATVLAQDNYPKNRSANVVHYIFHLTLNDSTNEIAGDALITVSLEENAEEFALDLVQKNEKFGMVVSNVYEGERQANYRFSNDKIRITPALEGAGNTTFRIQYSGIPEMGLVIDTTKFGQRSFFGDNWPNLARHWLPCVDHPYDKASIEFRVTAPEHYDVVATGSKLEESNLGNGYKLTSYYEPAPVAMKVATIGVTKFATKLLGVVDNIPVTAWVYPENKLAGFSDYQVATSALDYFIQNIGPYPFAKLANMQAKTRWGALENAGTISYFENSVTGNNEAVSTIAHEIAHQWFGNSATEKSWNHVWLSEGFATYFGTLFLEDTYGNEKRKEIQSQERRAIIQFYKRNRSPVVDNSISDPMNVLSTNSYEKGAWVLNMLRKKLGDEIFWKGIREYYETFKISNVLTEDFQQSMENVSEKNLDSFFKQWTYTPGHPQLKWNWTYEKSLIKININQVQDHFTFVFPLEIGIIENGKTRIETVQIGAKTESFEVTAESKPDEVILDPEVWLLFEEK